MKGRRGVAWVLLPALIWLLAGCGRLGGDRMAVTVFCTYGTELAHSKEAVEKEYSDIELKVEYYYGAVPGQEALRRLEHGDMSYIILLDQPPEEELYPHLLSLSGLADQGLEPLESSGGYCLAGPVELWGIGYNKTLFAENGWQAPTRYEEFIALCQQIEQPGMRALEWPMKEDRGALYSLYTLATHELLTSAQGERWARDYLDQQGSMTGAWDPVFAQYEHMVRQGLVRPGDLELTAQECSRQMVKRECAMTLAGPRLREELKGLGSAEEFGIMPFFGTNGSVSNWLYEKPAFYLSLNRSLDQSGNREELEAALRVVEFFRTEKGGQALSKDLMGAMPGPEAYLGNPAYEDCQQVLERGNVIPPPAFPRVEHTLAAGLRQLVLGRTTAGQVMAACDQANSQPDPVAGREALGRVKESLSWRDTALWAAEAIRAQTGADVAMVGDGSCFTDARERYVFGRLYEGDLTYQDLECAFAPARTDAPTDVLVVRLTGSQIKRAMEKRVAQRMDDKEDRLWFAVSGMTVEYSLQKGPNKRVEILDIVGQPLEAQREYSVALLSNSVSATTYAGVELDSVNLVDALAVYARAQGEIAPTELEDVRFG